MLLMGKGFRLDFLALRCIKRALQNVNLVLLNNSYILKDIWTIVKTTFYYDSRQFWVGMKLHFKNITICLFRIAIAVNISSSNTKIYLSWDVSISRCALTHSCQVRTQSRKVSCNRLVTIFVRILLSLHFWKQLRNKNGKLSDFRSKWKLYYHPFESSGYILQILKMIFCFYVNTSVRQTHE